MHQNTLRNIANWRGGKSEQTQGRTGGGSATSQITLDYNTFFDCYMDVLSDQLYRRYPNINDLSVVNEESFYNICRLSFAAVVNGLDVWEELAPQLISQISQTTSQQYIQKAG